MAKVGVITPVKNESDNLPFLIESVRDQTKQPHEWVIVDDGSDDGSSEIIKEASNTDNWISSIRRDSQSEYDVGFNYSHVISDGFAYLYNKYGNELDYYMILDGDMKITANYVNCLVNYIEENSDVKIVSGGMHIEDNDGGFEFVKKFEEDPIGGATVYDGDFYREIGGPPIAPSVDSVTRAKAEMRDWKCRYLTTSKEKAIQTRPTGGKGDPFESGASRGADNYYLYYHPSIAFAAGIKKLMRFEYKQGIGYLYGYFSNVIFQNPRIEDGEVKRYFYHIEPRKVIKNNIIFWR